MPQPQPLLSVVYLLDVMGQYLCSPRPTTFAKSKPQESDDCLRVLKRRNTPYPLLFLP